jgi:hypothetical protein
VIADFRFRISDCEILRERLLAANGMIDVVKVFCVGRATVPAGIGAGAIKEHGRQSGRPYKKVSS